MLLLLGTDKTFATKTTNAVHYKKSGTIFFAVKRGMQLGGPLLIICFSDLSRAVHAFVPSPDIMAPFYFN